MASARKDDPKNSYEAFNAVDQLVAKPVLGSDGAASWQDFQKTSKNKSSGGSVAPTAPLKAADRAAGFSSWHQERQNEAAVRQEQGDVPLHQAGYTTFKKSNAADEAAQRKRAKQIENRIRPDDVPYFIPADKGGGFAGWKFDYVFTTRDRGTGYYWDGMDSVKKLRGELKDEPAANEGENDTSAKRKSERRSDDTTASDTNAKSEKKKKKKRKKLRGPVIVNDPNNPLEQVAAALQKKQQQALDPLPPGWEATHDASSNKTYYYNRSTGERSWERPAPPPEVSLPAGWSVARDPNSGKEYYYNATSKETRWERP